MLYVSVFFTVLFMIMSINTESKKLKLYYIILTVLWALETILLAYSMGNFSF